MFDIKLKQAMNIRNLSITQLATMTGIGKSNISQYLSGKNEPRDNVKKILGEVLDCDFLGQEVQIIQGYEPFIFSTSNITLRQASRILHMSEKTLGEQIQKKEIPIGYAYKKDGSDTWGYYISPKLLYEVTGWREQ